MEPVLAMIDGGHAWSPSAWTFRQASLAVIPGEVLAILGPNGRGKTTLLRCLLGLLPLAEGQVRREGHPAYVPQAGGPALPYSVLEMVVMGRARHIGLFRQPSRADREVAEEALASLGLGHFRDRPFDRLSGGERQLVLLARALAAGSRAILLDEPASALDLRNQARLLALLRHLARERGVAVAFTTHAPEHAFDAADRAALLLGGHGLRCGPTGAVLDAAALSALYDVPVRCIPWHDGSRDRMAIGTVDP